MKLFILTMITIASLGVFAQGKTNRSATIKKKPITKCKTICTEYEIKFFSYTSDPFYELEKSCNTTREVQGRGAIGGTHSITTNKKSKLRRFENKSDCVDELSYYLEHNELSKIQKAATGESFDFGNHTPGALKQRGEWHN